MRPRYLCFAGMAGFLFVLIGCPAGNDDDDAGDDDTGDDDVGDDDTGDDDTAADDDTADDDSVGDDDAGDDDTSPPTGWVSMQAGVFTMGSPKNEVGHLSNETQHQVELTIDFEIGVTEVTQDQFEGVMGWNPSNCNFGCGSDYPVHTVSWFDAVAYANEASDEDGLLPCYILINAQCEDGTNVGSSYMACMNSTQEGIDDADVAFNAPATTPYECEGYRLPTEAEWEYASRSEGTMSDAFPNGGDLLPGDEWNCSGNLMLDDGSMLDDQSWYCGNTGGYLNGGAEPSGSLQPNPSDLYDMSGNVREWCHDWSESYQQNDADPWGPVVGSDRVIRSGSWSFFPTYNRAACRDLLAPGHRVGNLGMRLARTSP